MISSVAVITSNPLTKSAYMEYLKEIEKKIGTLALCQSEIILVETSQVWLHYSSAEESEYESEELEKFEALLGAPPRGFIEIEFNSGNQALFLALEVIKVYSTLFPMILDNGCGKIYRHEEISQLTVDTI
jgi:hypothetical protein